MSAFFDSSGQCTIAIAQRGQSSSSPGLSDRAGITGTLRGVYRGSRQDRDTRQPASESAHPLHVHWGEPVPIDIRGACPIVGALVLTSLTKMMFEGPVARVRPGFARSRSIHSCWQRCPGMGHPWIFQGMQTRRLFASMDVQPLLVVV